MPPKIAEYHAHAVQSDFYLRSLGSLSGEQFPQPFFRDFLVRTQQISRCLTGESMPTRWMLFLDTPAKRFRL